MGTVTPTILLIVDGWGQAPAGPGNAVSLAVTPTLDALVASPSHTLLACSGREVGLPRGFMGNSEVGHLNIGAGRIVNQDITRIDLAIEEQKFASNPVIAETIGAVKKSGGVLHLISLLSDGGVHSHVNHLFAMIDAGRAAGVPVVVHVFMDGRDSGPTSGAAYMRLLLTHCDATVRLGSLCGRYYAMDRDKRWERTALAWNALVHGQGERSTDAVATIEAAYAAGITDEFIKPVLMGEENQPPLVIRDGDGLFFLNFRADRARQLSRAFGDAAFTGFDRGTCPQLAAITSMTGYDASLPLPCAFPHQDIADTLGETLANAGLRQLRIAETEKYAHVTYFFNGGAEDPCKGEDRRIIPSPKDVATYDEKPEMSVLQVTERLLDDWNNDSYDVIVCNFANLDMVGHTGNIPATIKACEAVDACVARVIEAVKAKNGRIFITADHGNAEEMLTPEGEVQTSHSKNPVAFIVVDNGPAKRLKPGGKLGDIAPTILYSLGIAQPAAMTGTNLLEEA